MIKIILMRFSAFKSNDKLLSMEGKMRRGILLLSIVLIIPLMLTSCELRSIVSDAVANEKQQGSLNDPAQRNDSKQEGQPYLVRYMFATGKIPSDLKMVQDRISQITREKINVELELIPMSFGSINEKVNLKIASGEQLDLIFQRGNTFSADASRGLLTPLDDLLKNYGQGIKQAAGEFLKATAINGVTYAVPTLRDMAASYGLVARKDILDKHNIDTSSISTWEDVEEMFEIVRANEPELIITMPQIAGTQSVMTSGFITWDNLGDSLGVLMDHGSGLRVVNLFETDEYRRNLEIIRRWYRKDFIWEDASIAGDQANILVSAGKLFSYFANLKPGFDRQESLRAGRELVMFEIKPPFATTSQVALVSLSIPVTSGNPQKTMQFLNLMYSDPEVINLLNWGIEGVHYVRVPRTDNLIRFPDGVDAITSGYNLALGWQFGNQLLSYVWEGNNPDLYAEIGAFNETAIKSKALGFTFDSSMLNNEIAALGNVVAQYRIPLENGVFDPDIMLPVFIIALRDAGIDKVIAEKQRQLDVWADGME